MRVLIVDDNTSELELSSHILLSIFPEVTIERELSAEDAIENVKINLINENPYDLIITDLKLPRESGYKFIEWLRDLNVLSKIIILTGSASHYNAKRADCLSCPIVKKTHGCVEFIEYLNKIKNGEI